jgi:hypothetical protein
MSKGGTLAAAMGFDAQDDWIDDDDDDVDWSDYTTGALGDD